MIVSFDCYGTLIDWEKGITQALRPVLERHGLNLKDDEILELYAEIEPELEREYKPYREVLVGVVEEFGRRLGFEPSGEERFVLVDTIGDWPPFPEVREVLNKLKELVKIAVISNVDDDLFEKSERAIGVEFDYVVTAQRARAYKPSLKVFEYAQKVFGVSKGDWIHVGQSVFHDIIPARSFGLRTILVRRRGFGATPRVEGEADHVVDDLWGVLEVVRGVIGWETSRDI